MPTTSFYGMFIRDDFTTFFEFIFLITGFLSVLLSPKYVIKEDMPIGEFLAIQAYCVLGMMVVGGSGDLMAIFVGIELTSISVYMLTGFARNDRGSAEGAVKYFLLGIMATAILVYGMAWAFGMTGSTNLGDIRNAISANNLSQRYRSDLRYAAADSRFQLQNCGGTVPRLDTRRLRRCAYSGYGFYVGWA